MPGIEDAVPAFRTLVEDRSGAVARSSATGMHSSGVAVNDGDVDSAGVRVPGP